MLYLLVVREGLFALAVVLDNDHLVVVIGGPAKDGVNAALEKLHVVARGDEDGDERLLGGWPMEHMVREGTLSLGYLDVYAYALEVGAHRGHARLLRVGLGVAARCRGRLPHAPMVEDAGYVGNAAGLLYGLQRKVVVLRALERGVVKLQVHEEAAAHRKHVTDVVLAGEEVNLELRLEERLYVRACGVNLVLVAVEHVRLGIFVHGFGVVEEEVRLDRDVVVDKAHEVTGCRADSRSRVERDAQILVERDAADSLVRRNGGSNLLGKLPVLGGRVYQDELPVRIGLRDKPCHEVLELLVRGVEKRDNDAPRDLVVKAHLALEAKLPGLDLLLVEPLVVIGVAISGPRENLVLVDKVVEVGLCQFEEGVLVRVGLVPRVKYDGALVSGQTNGKDRLAVLDCGGEARVELLRAHEDRRRVDGSQCLVPNAKSHVSVIAPGHTNRHAYDGRPPVRDGLLDENGREEELVAIVVVADSVREVLVDAIVHAGLQLGVPQVHGCRANLKPRAGILDGPVGGKDGVGDTRCVGVRVDKDDHGFRRRIAEDLGGNVPAVVVLGLDVEKRAL